MWWKKVFTFLLSNCHFPQFRQFADWIFLRAFQRKTTEKKVSPSVRFFKQHVGEKTAVRDKMGNPSPLVLPEKEEFMNMRPLDRLCLLEGRIEVLMVTKNWIEAGYIVKWICEALYGWSVKAPNDIIPFPRQPIEECFARTRFEDTLIDLCYRFPDEEIIGNDVLMVYVALIRKNLQIEDDIQMERKWVSLIRDAGNSCSFMRKKVAYLTMAFRFDSERKNLEDVDMELAPLLPRVIAFESLSPTRSMFLLAITSVVTNPKWASVLHIYGVADAFKEYLEEDEYFETFGGVLRQPLQELTIEFND